LALFLSGYPTFIGVRQCSALESNIFETNYCIFWGRKILLQSLEPTVPSVHVTDGGVFKTWQ